MNELVSSLRSFATWRVLRASILCGLVASVVGCGSSGSAPEQLPDDPAVKGPITGPREPFVAGTLGINLVDVGYEQAEYFISGTAASYTNVGELDADGQWEVEGADTAEFNTRILVYRLVDANAFSGTVFVEWLNVSGGVDAAPDWSATHTEILREGHVWVGVSAQIVGIEGSDSGFGLHLKQVNPERYGELLHPGDSFSYDMYAQAAQAVRNPVDIKPLGELVAERVETRSSSTRWGMFLAAIARTTSTPLRRCCRGLARRVIPSAAFLAPRCCSMTRNSPSSTRHATRTWMR